MTWIAGSDGCKGGWLRASRHVETGELRFDVIDQAAGLLEAKPVPDILTIDIPIGLTESGPRACDVAARQVLGPRRSSVFPAPVRPALVARNQTEASALTRRADGRGVSAQGFAIYAKVREVDELFRCRPGLQARVREVHPEVCFWALNGYIPLDAPKKDASGARARRALVEDWLEPGVFELARSKYRKSLVQDNDILDALVALWTAERIRGVAARTIPDDPPEDRSGLRMEIVY